MKTAAGRLVAGKLREVGTEGRAAQFKRRFGSIATRRQS